MIRESLNKYIKVSLARTQIVPVKTTAYNNNVQTNVIQVYFKRIYTRHRVIGILKAVEHK